jgi:hypothetical protein
MHKWNKLYDYPKSVRELINSKRHYSIDGSKLPSVTTILDQTNQKKLKLVWLNGDRKLAKLRQKELRTHLLVEALKCTQL